MTTSRFWAIAYILPVFSVSCLLGCGSGTDAVLGTTDQNPVVLLKPATGMTIQLTAVTYDQFGRIESYEAIVSRGQRSETIKVRQAAPAQYGKSAEYVAEVNGKTIPTLKDTNGSGEIGFSLKDQGGAVLTYVKQIQLSMKSELGYDQNGRGHVKRQTFTHEGKTFDIAYSNHSYDKNGRLAGYQVQIQKAD